MTVETVVPVEMLVAIEIIMISGVVYYNHVMDNILSPMASGYSNSFGFCGATKLRITLYVVAPHSLSRVARFLLACVMS